MHEGVVSTRIGLQGIPAASEEIMVYRDISLAKLTGCPVHIAHVSTAGSVGLIRKAKEEGIPVTAETAPHYFSLDHSAVIGYDTNAKVNPPLRTPSDVQEIKKGLVEGVIDVIIGQIGITEISGVIPISNGTIADRIANILNRNGSIWQRHHLCRSLSGIRSARRFFNGDDEFIILGGPGGDGDGEDGHVGIIVDDKIGV